MAQRFITVCFLFVVSVAAVPQGKGSPGTLPNSGLTGSIATELGRIGGVPGGQTTWNDFSNSEDCKEIIAIIARGSMEPGNVGVTTGPYICSSLKQAYPNRFACQGVSPTGYAAGIADNGLPKGTTESAIKEGIALFEKVHQRCPRSLLLFEGYSQGAAVMHNVIAGVSAATRAQITAGVLFGDTRYRQSNGAIEGLADDKLRVFCYSDDPVCVGAKGITAGHVAYLSNGDLRKSVDWLIGKTDAELKARGQPGGVPLPAAPPPASKGGRSRRDVPVGLMT